MTLETAAFLALLLLGTRGAEPAQVPGSAWTGFDSAGYRLEHDNGRYTLVRSAGASIPIPKEWLEPAGAREEDAQTTVSSLAYVPEVTAFPIGAGRWGLHLASYDVQEQGSLQAAAGRDILLIVDPSTGRLTRGGLQLGVSRSRARLGGCFAALFHHVSVGDVDCDRKLDLAIVREEVSCGMASEGPGSGATYSRSAMRWYRQGAAGWLEDPSLDGRLPCAGLAQLPLLGLVKTPIDFVLEKRLGADPLPSGRPKPFAE